MTGTGQRIAWVDYAKGFCIVLVVTMHSTLGVEAALGESGWMHAAVAFAKPFRIPAFFLVAGLFLAHTIDRDWRRYADRKIVHFAYFYALWVTIQFALRMPGLVAEQGVVAALFAYLNAYIEPFGTLWFIYLLPFFFVAAKLTRNLPWPLVFAAAAALEIAPVETGSVVVDEFSARFVYFYAGYVLARPAFAVADAAARQPMPAVLVLAAWGIANALCVARGYADLAFVSLALGFAGAAAIVAASSVLAQAALLTPLRYCGRHSLVIYLAFSLFMATMRIVLVKLQILNDAGTISLIVTLAAVVGPLVLHALVRSTRLSFLFERPQFFQLRHPLSLSPQR